MTDEHVDPALEAALREGDFEAALVLGDRLQELGHPRGALIAVQAALETASDPDLVEREKSLVEDFLGPLAALVVPRGQRHEPSLSITWRRGFITQLRIDGFHDDGPALIRDLLADPSTRFLRELAIGCHRGGDQDNSLMTEAILGTPSPPPLRTLYLADFDDSDVDQIDISRAYLGDLSSLAATYPRLEDIILKGNGAANLGAFALPSARRFAFRTSTLTRTTLRTIADAPWPLLEALELWFGEADYGANCTADDLLPLLRNPMPSLHTLRLMNADFSDELVTHVAASPLVAQLATFDLSLGTLTSAGAALLVEHAAKFSRVTRLGVFDCSLDDAALDTMRRAGLPVDETPNSPAEATCLGWRQVSRPGDYTQWRRPRCTQKRERFVSVGE